MRKIWLVIFVGVLWVSNVSAQRDAPVWEAYLPQVSIYHIETNKTDALAVDFLFKKNGGPSEHTEHQAYLLVYLTKDEAQILKLAADPQLVKKKNEKSKQLIDVLIEKKLIVAVESQAVKLNSANGKTPRFQDVRGNPKREGVESLAAFSFPFKFTLPYETLFRAVQTLGNFRADNINDGGSTVWFNDNFKLLVFVPVNDSVYATKVSAEIRKNYDFAYSMDFETSLLYFRPLPYEFEFAKFRGNTLLLYIH